MSSARLAAVLLLTGLAVAGGCGGDDGSAADPTTGDESADELMGTVTVSAAASLSDAFEHIAQDFSAIHPDVEVVVNADSSTILATQILEGVPADVFASADEENVTRLEGEGLVVGEARVFARNELVIVTRPGNPDGIDGLADLGDAGVVALCGEDVPCGRYAAEALAAADVSIPEGDITRGQNVTATLTAVTQGDAVAGIVYASDATRAGDAVDAVAIPPEENVVAEYPVVVLDDATDPVAAEAFVAFVLSDDGQAVLEAFGFRPAS